MYRVTHEAVDTRGVEDEVWEPILYLPERPHVAAMLDGLAGGTRVGAGGQLTAPTSSLLYLLGPVGVLAVNGVCAAFSNSFK